MNKVSVTSAIMYYSHNIYFSPGVDFIKSVFKTGCLLWNVEGQRERKRVCQSIFHLRFTPQAASLAIGGPG